MYKTFCSSSSSSSPLQISGLEMEVLQLKGSVKHYDGIVTEYKAQLDRSRAENEELSKELRTKDQEMDQIKQESIIETEKVVTIIIASPASLLTSSHQHYNNIM